MHGLSTYALTDFAGSMVGAFAFTLLFGLFGYAIGSAFNIVDFRTRSLADRLCWATLIGLPSLVYSSVMLWKYTSFAITAACVIAISACGAAYLVRNTFSRRDKLRERLLRPGLWGLSALVAWYSFVALQLIDFQWRGKLYMSFTSVDHFVRNAFVLAVERTGVPPHNPLYWSVSAAGSGVAAPMRYYYFWYVPCALIARLFHLSSRQALIGSCAWSGLVLVCVILLYSRHFIGGDEASIKRRSWIGAGLIVVTGLDVLVVAFQRWRGEPFLGDMEWWSDAQVASWMDTILWVPHHLAALVCCSFGFLLIWMILKSARTNRWGCGIVAALAFASSLGLSTYITIAFAMVMVAWLVWSVSTSRINGRQIVSLCATAAFAVILVIPYVRELRADGPNTDATHKTAHVLALGTRNMMRWDDVPYLNRALNSFQRHHPQVVKKHTFAIGRAVSLLLLVPGYVVEFGVYGLVLGIVLWRAFRVHDLSDAEQHALFITLAGLLVCTFIRSNVIATNDFGMRASLIPQFFLLILALSIRRETINRLGAGVKALAAALLIVGVASTCYQVIMLRLYYPVAELRHWRNIGGLSSETMALRRAADEIGRLTDSNAVVQFNLHQPDQAFIYAHSLNTPRQVANGDSGCVYVFGGDPSACPQIMTGIGTLYRDPEYSGASAANNANLDVSSAGARKICDALKIDYLVATRQDSIWKEPNAWPWTLPVLFADPDVRVIDCRESKI